MATAKPTKKYRKRQNNRLASILWAVAGIVFVVVSLLNLRYIFFGEDNIIVLYQLKQENQRMSRVITELRQENIELRKYIHGLKNDPQIIEEEIRSKLNLIKEGEILYLDDGDK